MTRFFHLLLHCSALRTKPLSAILAATTSQRSLLRLVSMKVWSSSSLIPKSSFVSSMLHCGILSPPPPPPPGSIAAVVLCGGGGRCCCWIKWWWSWWWWWWCWKGLRRSIIGIELSLWRKENKKRFFLFFCWVT